MSDKKALLIGINYKDDPYNRLYGCINDTYMMRSLLNTNFNVQLNNITLMNDDHPISSNLYPTYDNMIKQLNDFINNLNKTKTSSAYIFFSGHGYQLKDTNGDEIDGYDEQIVPVDFQSKGFISDDFLFSIFLKLNRKTKLYFMSDACNSGTNIDLPFIFTNNRFIYNNKFRSSKRFRTVKDYIKTININSNNIISISSSRDEQYSIDGFNLEKNQNNGVFTMAFDKLIREHGVKLNFNDFLTNISKYIDNSYGQTTTITSTKQLNSKNTIF
jgi:hypothetical protein